MEAEIYKIDGSVGGRVELPAVFSEYFDVGLVRRAILSEQSSRYQPQGHYLLAGMQTTAVYVGTYSGYRRGRHMGYSYRTELNKIVLRIGTPADAQSVMPKGGFINYGLIRNDYAVVDGSIPGPAKRLVRIRKSLRGKGVAEPKVQYISTSSKQGV